MEGSGAGKDVQMEMVCIPAGVFLYGEGKEERELPEFWIGRTPITNAQYTRFVAATGHEPPAHWQGETPPAQIADHPVTHVSWHDAAAYAGWAGKRLLSEEEWEKAARGSDGQAYPWGDWAEGRCNTKEAGVGTTTPVGQYSPEGDSPYGCVDMAGNVFEWMASVDGKYRVLRGGSYNHDRTLAGCAFRIRHVPSYRYRNLGFRVGKSGRSVAVQHDHDPG
jgi:formylglycine-generating enzyme required for sulfatase activity